MGEVNTSSIGTQFYHHKEKSPTVVHIHAKRVGRVLYRNVVNVYRLTEDQDPKDAKLVMFGITIRSSQAYFNLGDVRVNPGDRLFAQVIKPGLALSATIHGVPVDNFAALFD